jgi:3-hydroxy acid dehydrogenase/malonic semialdehyde reductase
MPRAVIVTGATSEFGDAIARRFVTRGTAVLATGRREQRLLRLQKELGDLLHPLVLDGRDRSAANRGFATLPSMFPKVDLLVNNDELSLSGANS